MIMLVHYLTGAERLQVLAEDSGKVRVELKGRI
jgi:hypothetical protein